MDGKNIGAGHGVRAGHRCVRRSALALAGALAYGAMAASTKGQPIYLSDVAAGRGGFVVDGAHPDEVAGLRIVGLGDVNGDGRDDFLVVATPVPDAPGHAYVVFGKPDTSPVELSAVAIGQGGFLLQGSGSFRYIGVAAAGDMNGDGLADIAFCGGAAADKPCYVVFGKTDTAPVMLSDVGRGHGGFVIHRHPRDEGVGASIAVAGDVNGDGLADLVIGFPDSEVDGVRLAGRCYVVFGKGDGTEVDLSDLDQGRGDGFAIQGSLLGGYAGQAVSGAGDVNGDGLGDVIVGAPSERYFSASRGHSYVVFGKSDTGPVKLSELDKGHSGGFVIVGAQLADKSGLAVRAAGDLDGDGLADVLVGAPGSNYYDTRGKAYIVFGKTGFEPVALSDIEKAQGGGYAIFNDQDGGHCGSALADAGDLNQDGRRDLLMGCGLDGSEDTGESFVVYGKSDPAPVHLGTFTNSAAGFVIFGEHSHDASGSSVSAADVDGDGLPDLLVSAPAFDKSTGRTYVIFDPATDAVARQLR